MATFSFEFVTPEKRVFAGEVTSVIVPGFEGEFQVLSGHAPLISLLKPGFVTVATETQTQTFYVRGGFADVSGTGLTLLAERALPYESIDPDVLLQELVWAEGEITHAPTETARQKARYTASQIESLQLTHPGAKVAA